MSGNIAVSNLPVYPVGKVIIQNEPLIVKALNNMGIECIHPAEDEALDKEVSLHSDMLCCITDEKNCIVSPGQTELKSVLEEEGFTVSVSEKLKGNYPGDVLLNVALAGSYAIGNFKYTDKTLLRLLKGRELINVNQGYAKCSVCFVDENAAITEDESIAEALTEKNIDVLLISKGDIYLSEKHYGFFGGSSGKIAKDILAVTGSLSTHRDGERIRNFAFVHGVKITELTTDKIKDIGGILPLKYK